MKGRYLCFVLIFFIIPVILPLTLYSDAPPIVETTARDRSEIALCIYNNNLGLVRELRQINLPNGFSELRFKDISILIQPNSVRVTSPHRTSVLDFLEQSYEYDLVSPKKLMDKYVGHKLKLIERDEETGAKIETQAELISNDQGPVYLIDGEIHIGHPGTVVLPKLPDDLIVHPALVWKINAQEGKKYPLEVFYLTEGLDWETDYAILLNAEETRGDMSAWVTIQNNTGSSYEDAAIQLIAGDVSRIREHRRGLRKESSLLNVFDKGVSEEGISEYHLYELPGKFILKDNQTKQIQLLTADRVPIKKELRYYGKEQFYRNRYNQSEDIQRVGVYLEFENKKTYHLGIPLPEGIVRAYKKDSMGRIQFLGEDMISHVPEDEKVRIQIGYAFDVVCERRQMDWQKLALDLTEVVLEIILKNHKSEAVWIVIIEPVPGDWEVMESSHRWKKEDAHTLRFDVSVAPGAQEKIRYRLRSML